MMILRMSLLMMMFCIAGCASKKKPQTELDQSHATIYYQEQEAKRSQLERCGTTVRHQKEIDADSIELDDVSCTYVWSVDIPVPVRAVAKRGFSQAKPDAYAIGYTATESQEQLAAFYKQQMELLGWHCWWEMQSLETLLLFEKPNTKQCSVSIRPTGSRNKTDIIIMQRTV